MRAIRVRHRYAIALFLLIGLALVVAARGATVQLGSRVTLVTKLRVMQSDLVTGVGLQEAGATGTVIGGPVKVGQRTWWLVDFGSGVDGWVFQDVSRVSTSSRKYAKCRARIGPSSSTWRNA